MSTSEYTAPAPAGSRPVEYATFSRRLGAALLDSLVWIVGLAFFNPFAVVGDNEAVAGLLVLIVFSAWFNYFAICEWRWGQTIGKNALGIRVLPLQAGELSWQAAAMRNLLRIADFPLSMLGIDYLIVQRSERRQRLGDRAAKTIVVRERASATATSEHRSPPVSVPAPQVASQPTAGELFGDAAAALGRQPAAGSQPRGAVERDELRDAPARASWTAAGFPYARWEPRRTWLGLVAGLLIGGLFAPLLVVPFDPDLDSTGALLAAQALLELTLLSVALWVASDGGREPSTGRPASGLAFRERMATMGLRPVRVAAFGWVAAGLAAYFAFTIAYGLLITEPDQQDIARDLGLDRGLAAAIPVVFLIAVVAPVVEETFFRGMFFGGLRLRFSTLTAALISGAVFGSLHLTTGVSAVPPLIVFGIVLALLYERTGSLLPAILAHMINNALALAVAS